MVKIKNSTLGHIFYFVNLLGPIPKCSVSSVTMVNYGENQSLLISLLFNFLFQQLILVPKFCKVLLQVVTNTYSIE
jgi:hypothetical protein